MCAIRGAQGGKAAVPRFSSSPSLAPCAVSQPQLGAHHTGLAMIDSEVTSNHTMVRRCTTPAGPFAKIVT